MTPLTEAQSLVTSQEKDVHKLRIPQFNELSPQMSISHRNACDLQSQEAAKDSVNCSQLRNAKFLELLNELRRIDADTELKDVESNILRLTCDIVEADR